MAVTPIVSIEVDGSSAGPEFVKRLSRCEVKDGIGQTSDSASLTIDMAPAADGSVPLLPQKGVELGISMGYLVDAPAFLGTFVVDAVELKGAPLEMSIRANAANLRAELNASADKHFGDVTLGEVVSAIATDAGLTAAVASDVASFAYEGLNQSGESPLSFLKRLANDLGAEVKVVAKHLVVSKPGEGRSISGQDLPEVEITRADVQPNWRYVDADRNKFKGAVASWHSVDDAEKKTVEIGEAPFVRLRSRTFANEAAAKAAAQAELDRKNRGASTFEFTCSGHPGIFAEGRVRLSGFGHEEINQVWSVKSVTHVYDGNGYTTHVTCEVPKQ